MNRRVPALFFCLLFGAVLTSAVTAKKEKAPPADAPPELISKDGGKVPWTDAPLVMVPVKAGRPRWTTLDQLQQLAAQGDPPACFELGARAMEGDGVPRDVHAAEKLFEQAAKGGVTDAWFRLGKIHHDGLAGGRDYSRALDCFTAAARAGVVEAQHNIGAMLVSARGVKRDYVEGLAWLIVAKQAGAASDAEAQVRDRLARRPTDIAAAEARATELAKDPAHATPRAVRLGADGKPLAGPVPAPVIAPPKIEVSAPPKISLSITPVAPPTPASRP